MSLMNTVPVVVAGYLMGSIPFALILARRWGAADLRDLGSGNVGAANVLRVSGVTAAVLVALLDVAKGCASVMLAQRVAISEVTTAATGLAAIVGHVYPVWIGFRGGKGVATACGVFAVLTPAALPPAVGLFLAAVWITRYISVGSVMASAALPSIAYWLRCPEPAVLAAAGAAMLIVFRHRSNLARVRAGSERRIGARP